MKCDDCKKELKKKLKSFNNFNNNKVTYLKKFNWNNREEVDRYILVESYYYVAEDWLKIDNGYSFWTHNTEFEKHWPQSEINFSGDDNSDNFMGLLKKISKKEFFEAAKILEVNSKKLLKELKEK